MKKKEKLFRESICLFKKIKIHQLNMLNLIDEYIKELLRNKEKKKKPINQSIDFFFHLKNSPIRFDRSNTRD